MGFGRHLHAVLGRLVNTTLTMFLLAIAHLICTDAVPGIDLEIFEVLLNFVTSFLPHFLDT